MNLLKQSTAVTVVIGPFLDASDGVTEETALGTPAVELSKAGGSFASASTGTTAHLAEGWYDCDLDSTDTNTLGRLIIKSHNSATHLPVWHEFMVVPANVYDSLVAGTDDLDAQVVGMDNDVVTAAAIATGAIDTNALASGAITAASIASAAANKVADHVLRRSWATAAASSDGDTKSFRSLLGAIAKLVNKIAISGSTLTIYEADDSTSLGTQTVTTDAAADPITSLDTA